MSEIPSGISDAEGSNHWCPTYQGLQRQLSALERIGGGKVRVNYSQEQAPEVWEGRTGYPPEELIPTLIVQEARQGLYQHRTSCEPCVAHFSPGSA